MHISWGGGGGGGGGGGLGRGAIVAHKLPPPPPPLVRMYGDSRQAVIVSLLKSQNQAACPLQKNNILQCFDFVIMVKK